MQFSCVSFYEPARKALLPTLVPARQLHLATTIDSFAWSVTGAVGASIGGLVSRLGQDLSYQLEHMSHLAMTTDSFVWSDRCINRRTGASFRLVAACPGLVAQTQMHVRCLCAIEVQPTVVFETKDRQQVSLSHAVIVIADTMLNRALLRCRSHPSWATPRASCWTRSRT